MSYTIIHDREYEARQITNLVNIVKRHCKIGKVKPKRVDPPWKDRGFPKWTAPGRDWWDDPFRPTWNDDLMIGANRKCSCKPGQACGNAACPHGLFPISRSGYLNPMAIWVQ